jgi:hypothetical protein
MAAGQVLVTHTHCRAHNASPQAYPAHHAYAHKACRCCLSAMLCTNARRTGVARKNSLQCRLVLQRNSTNDCITRAHMAVQEQ